MKKTLSIFAVYLLALFIAACSTLFKNKGVNNLTEKPLALAAQAYALMADADSKATVTYDLERAYRSNGATQAVINRLLKKETKPETADDKDDDMQYLAEIALDEKKPNFKKALIFASDIKRPKTKSEVLLRIAEDMPKNKRLFVLREADKAIAKTKMTNVVYEKRSKLLKLAKMYFESGDKKSARKTIISSHPLLIRNTSSANALDYGTVAELESQLGVQPATLCKLTRFLHKTKDRPIALARITAAYMNHGYQGQVCMPDKELVAVIRNIPDARDQVTELLVLAEAWHTRKKQDKSDQLYNGAINLVKLITPKEYQYDVMTKVLISLKKTTNKKFYSSYYNDYWKLINKQSPYEQSGTLMQLSLEAYDVEGLSDLSLDALSKIKEHSLKVTSAVTLARIAHKKNEESVAKQALNEAFLAAKTTPYPTPKMDWLREVIDSAHALGDTKIVEKALKVAAKSVSKVPDLELKVMYANLLVKQAWEHKDYRLAEALLKQNQLWYEQWIKQPIKTEKSDSKGIDPHADNKRNTLIVLVKANVLLGNNSNAITLLDRLPNKNLQTKALVYAAIILAEKRKKQGAKNTDVFMLNTLESKIQDIRNDVLVRTNR